MSKFYLNDRFSVELGPQFGWLINQVTKTRNLDGFGASTSYTQRVSGDFILDYGVAAGVEFRFNDQLSMAPRCYLGLRNRLNGNAMESQNYNIALQVSLNYTFLGN